MFSILKQVPILIVYEYLYNVCMCTMYMSGTCGDQNKMLDPLELVLWMAVSCHVGAKDWARVSMQALMHSRHFPDRPISLIHLCIWLHPGLVPL